MKDYIKKLISERESKMYGYYSSVFKEGFEGGYPMEYDKDLLEVEQELIKKVKQELCCLYNNHAEGYPNLREVLSVVDNLASLEDK